MTFAPASPVAPSLVQLTSAESSQDLQQARVEAIARLPEFERLLPSDSVTQALFGDLERSLRSATDAAGAEAAMGSYTKLLAHTLQGY